jgi:GT2 family glycosyltransferase
MNASDDGSASDRRPLRLLRTGSGPKEDAPSENAPIAAPQAAVVSRTNIEAQAGLAMKPDNTAERRAAQPSGVEPSNELIRTAPVKIGEPAAQSLRQTFEALLVSRGGGVFAVGWIDDYSDPVASMRVIGKDWRVTFSGATLGRSRRLDVEDALDRTYQHPFAFYGFIYGEQPIMEGGPCRIEVKLASGAHFALGAEAKLVSDSAMRDIVLSAISASMHFGNAQVKAIEGVDRGAGFEILKLNSALTAPLVSRPYVERFGRTDAGYEGSIIVCLYGKPEFLFLQSALFASVPGIERYEFIFVSNSPELAETLLREAKACALIYGLDITLVLLPGNAGFGAANNAAVQHARSRRVLIVNPDVAPIGEDWADRHALIVSSLSEEQTRIFGAALYYDDGSLMHGGMHFELDSSVNLDNGRYRRCQLLRVEHYGKGAPPGLATFTRPRPVPAVTGAFMSCDRAWFEHLEGFTEDYVFGHYEDADLCLKSLQAGTPVWMQDLKLWHLEGRGSVRLPVHEGGSLVNRWLFTTTWGGVVTDGLLGHTPQHPAFAPSDPLQSATGTEDSVKRSRRQRRVEV